MGLFAAVVVLAATAAVGAPSAAVGPVVHADGRIGVFRIDRTTEADVRAVAGRPFRVETVFWPGRARAVGRSLWYRCGSRCRTVYSFSYSSGALSDFFSESPRFRTARGGHVGMTAARAVAIERRRVIRGCGIGNGGHIYVRMGPGPIFVLNVWGGRVRSMTFLGQHSVAYEGLC